MSVWVNISELAKNILRDNRTPMILSWVFAFMVICNSWMSDDAYISFRTVDNFVNGYGLRYNILERVQTFTNPLLVLILIPIHFIFHNLGDDAIYYESFGLSFLFLLIFLVLLNKIFKNKLSHSLVLILLITNIPILDYFTSGLENSLNFVLIALLVYALAKKKMLLLNVIAGFLVLSRLDLALLILPLILYNLLIENHPKKIIHFLIFLTPCIIWVLFSIVYYGSILPNSVIAKSAFSPSLGSVFGNSLNYLFGTLYFHPMAIILPMFLLVAFKRSKSSIKALLVGTSLYLVLPFIGGGDFMSGRFQTVPSVFLLLLMAIQPIKFARLKALLIVTCVLFFVHTNSLFIQAINITSSETEVMKFNTADEKRFYFWYTSLARRVLYIDKIGDYEHSLEGKETRKVEGHQVKKYLMAGFCGYYCSPNVYLTDRIGIVDPLLARLPSVSSDKWRPGHPIRRYPKGYLESLEKNKNLIEDPTVRLLYDDLILATRNYDLFSLNRWKAIWRLNTGFHTIKRDYE